MSLEQDIANVVSAAEQLTGIVDTKIGDINNTVNTKVAEMNTRVAQKETELDNAVAHQVGRIDAALDNLGIIGDGSIGTKSIAVATYFSGDHGASYIHIKLPFKIDEHNCTYHIGVSGYALQEGKIVDSTFVGYCNEATNKLVHPHHSGTHEPYSYIGSDQHVYLRLNFESKYYLSLSVDSMYVGNGRIIKRGEIEVIASPAEKLPVVQQ
ncbi:hypothetical protein J8M20_21795 [Pseudoalteromonas luteoviolacea]|uniref:hypothetical protein n=1 Tax=Pseudoalteromonas luteoviolacea TaxID=43657 RepID=UPI001B377F37|nr:hypothetical protein [Pseudoalteromonas luteoviolacea]MBQ4814014.1 hypothetical protein [Pseudoalteromonas luteoviolacea]